MQVTFQKGQKIYRWNGRIEEWTYVRKTDKHIMLDPNNQYGYFINAEEIFFENKEQCEIQQLKKVIKSQENEKEIISNKLKNYQVQVRHGKELLKTVEKKIKETEKRYKYFQEKYPEEFI